MEAKERVRYDRTLLNKCLERDEATLVGEYEKVNYETKIKFVCKCGLEGEKGIPMVVNNGGLFCKSCTQKLRIEKSKQTNFERYGVEHPSQNKEVQQKTKNTNLERYGVENPGQSEIIKEKMKKTNLENYGVEYPSQTEKIKKKSIISSIKKYGCHHTQNKSIKEKMKKTNIEKYGVENPMQNEVVKEKTKNTNLDKYGVENPLQNKEVQKRQKKTNLERYGVENPLQNKEVQKRQKKTNLERYGVENPTQNTEIFEKAQANMKKFKNYKMPSGEIRRVQGYEPFALDALLKMYTEEQIITQRKKIPRISYNMNTKECYYFPDIYIPDENKIIEVKSTWTIKINPDIIVLKKRRHKTQDTIMKFGVLMRRESAKCEPKINHT